MMKSEELISSRIFRRDSVRLSLGCLALLSNRREGVGYHRARYRTICNFFEMRCWSNG
jgi:hypothetical protein